ncbi:hypothetical protein EVAR_64267_1 [Eumeta japonica]|uniref:Uncharacterized protein n=1 Tax=Eumeta variegata TaxID=151549 RepID=A0A4C2A646_EUMVA|nr:hypothetical protein EVAR_64267_1 [Eumeta japonica]
MIMRTIKNQVVTAAHVHLQLQKSHHRVSGFLDRNSIFHGRKSELTDVEVEPDGSGHKVVENATAVSSPPPALAQRVGLDIRALRSKIK